MSIHYLPSSTAEISDLIHDVFSGYDFVFSGYDFVFSGYDFVFSGYDFVFSGYDFVFSGYDFVFSGYDFVFSGYDFVFSGYDFVFSGYDFGYMLKLLTCVRLPPEEQDFFELLKIFFPNIYDVKYLMKSCKNLKGGLQEVADQLEVSVQSDLVT